MKNIEGNCPHCGNPIEVDMHTGAFLKKTKVSTESFNEALKKISQEKNKRQNQFEQLKENLDKKKKESDALFQKSLDEIKEKGLGDKPIRDIDL